jgi:Mn2+/Fe2+ NRAMP family transporter
VLVGLAALGPGILGLVADNDAGGMTSYLVTGGRHQLVLFLAALLVAAAIAVVVQEMALRLALSTRAPFGRVVREHFGAGLAAALALANDGLNVLILATELSGMGMALALTGLTLPEAVLVALALVLAMGSWIRYRALERALLGVAVLNLAFLAAVLALPAGHYVVSPWHWGGSWAGTPLFLLAMLGNGLAPWMVYWQQDAVVARNMQRWELKRGRFDLLAGALAQVTMAGAVLWLGASLAGNPMTLQNPVAWVSREGGRTVGLLFALGLFDAGLLAAATITRSSHWMLRGALFGRRDRPLGLVVRGIDAGGPLAAVLLVLLPNWSQGFLALLTQALAGLLMPGTLFCLGLLTNRRDLLGPLANRPWQRALWPVLVGVFGLLAIVAWV